MNEQKMTEVSEKEVQKVILTVLESVAKKEVPLFFSASTQGVAIESSSVLKKASTGFSFDYNNNLVTTVSIRDQKLSLTKDSLKNLTLPEKDWSALKDFTQKLTQVSDQNDKKRLNKTLTLLRKMNFRVYAGMFLSHSYSVWVK